MVSFIPEGSSSRRAVSARRGESGVYGKGTVREVSVCTRANARFTRTRRLNARSRATLQEMLDVGEERTWALRPTENQHGQECGTCRTGRSGCRQWNTQPPHFLGGALAAGAAGAAVSGASAEPLAVQPWMRVPGAGFAGYGQPSRFESKVVRFIPPPPNPATQGVGAARTPLHLLDGMITPSGLHFERSHSGIPDIDPDQHRLVIHGLVKRPLVFTLEALHRYPMQSRIAFIECAGNSQRAQRAAAAAAQRPAIHGLLGCSEWTGVKLSTLLDEAGVEPAARWVIAEGADSAAMSRSIPLAKAMDDALVCLYQNGERVRPSNGYPVRLLLPGFEGNMNVKWLRRLKLTAAPAMTKDETSKYTILLKDEKAWQFVFPMEVKSVITRPSPGLALKGPGFYEISGLAWSGNGSIRQVEVSADGGRAGRRRRCRARSCRRRRCASARRGNGTADRRCCKAAPPTTPAWCSRRARSSPPSAACAASTTTTPSQAGASTRRGRPPMSMLERLQLCAA